MIADAQTWCLYSGKSLRLHSERQNTETCRMVINTNMIVDTILDVLFGVQHDSCIICILVNMRYNSHGGTETLYREKTILAPRPPYRRGGRAV